MTAKSENTRQHDETAPGPSAADRALERSDAPPSGSVPILSWTFFASGFSALLYQIIWQRTLFTLYGINVESVTMIVTTFMVGLGFGSLLGGLVSQKPTRPVALLFSIFEAIIGVYGLFSLALFHGVGALTLQSSASVIAFATFFMILVPTTLMGATLPLLTAHFTRIQKSVGDSLGALYHMNTLGAAAGALLGGMLIMAKLGQSGTLRVAAALNFLAAGFAFIVHLRSRGQTESASHDALPASPTDRADRASVSGSGAGR